MCYESDARPPVTTEPITSTTTAQLVLTSADGARFAGFEALPGEESGPAVLLLPDNRGLFGFYEQLAVHLAGHGHPTLAVDYFGRTAGTDYRARGAEFRDLANLMPNHLAKLTRPGLYGDWDAALDHLRGPHARTVVALGFCMGGRFAFQAADARFGLAGAIGLYGYPGELGGQAGPTRLAAGLTAPILALWGGADDGITPEVIDEFDRALTAAGNDHAFVTYPGAPHGFFEMANGEHAEACADAWDRVLAFLAASGK